MGRRITQRILTCDLCGRTPENGEYLWEMNGEHWCEKCIDKMDSEEDKSEPDFKND